MKVLVTGGAGFIGSNLVEGLVRANHEVVVYDALTYACGNDPEHKWDRLVDLPVKKAEGDIRDLDRLKASARGCEYIFHLAAESHVTRSEKEPELFRQVNVGGTSNVVKVAVAYDMPMIKMSTDEVYGPIRHGYFAENDKHIGDDKATSPYAKSKAEADDLVMSAMRAGLLKATIVRPTNNYGPWQFPEKLLPRSIARLLRGEKIRIWGQGLQIRDWLHVEDTVRALMILMEKGRFGQVYNIGANNDPELNNRQIAEMVVELMDLSNDWIEMIDEDPRPDHDFRYAVDSTKIRALAWGPLVSVREGLKQTIDWYRSHREWWEPMIAASEANYSGKEKIKE